MTAPRILVVDDDDETLNLFGEVLARFNAEVQLVNDSRVAAKVIQEKKFDVIFLDLQMPYLDGFALEQVVRNSTFNTSTPIVVVTARDLDDTLFRSFSLGATFFLQKPVETKQLVNLLDAARRMGTSNRRHYLRVPVNAEVKVEAGAIILMGRTLNLSQCGIQVVVEGLRAGQIVRLSFRMDNGALVREVHGMVAWERDGTQGIMFTNVSVQNQADILRFIARLDSPIR